MNAADVMTARVLSVGPESSIVDAVKLMLAHNISGLPVVDSDCRLLGIVSEGDFLRRAETGTERRRPRWLEFLLGPGRLADEYIHTHGRKIEEVMTTNVATVSEETPLDDVVRMMERRHIKRVPVMRDGQLVGIITRANLLRALASIGDELRPSVSNDADLRRLVMSELEKQNWTPNASVDVTVRNGIVQLWGIIFDERQRGALRVVVENIGGVKEVKDHLTWVEPMSGLTIEGPDDRQGPASENAQ